MRVLLGSTILYLAGIAVALYFRPALMFHPDGRWKEFGTTPSEDSTMFPFWLFCVTWAIVSFFVVRIILGPEDVDPGNVGLMAATVSSASSAAAVAPGITSVSRSPKSNSMVEEEDAVMPIPPPANKNRRRNKEVAAPPPVQTKTKVVEVMKPGYYKLDREAGLGENGIPRYIYMGPTPPVDSDVSDEEES
jgi:hypothetical protein